ncbi:adenylyl cyclase-associated protein-like isoform X2 [Clytia hemisphaerica]|uniref:adenylyl cyclase-associated protein-like isoform X2 n=1 Tax=Clytia hemisphaerica TaxID=252671 RepID=UPI0034D714C6
MEKMQRWSKSDDPDWYDDYVAFHKENFDSFLKATEGLGGDVASIGKLVGNAFSAHKDVVTIAARNGRPSGSDLPTILIPLSNAITAVQEFRDANRKSAQFNHLSALSEAIPFLGWVSISPKPGQYVGQMEESAQFYTNKVLKEFKESDPKQADWARSLIKLLKATTQHVKDNHGTGLQWNKDKPAATGATKAGGAPSAGGAPPPPPPAAAPPPPPPAPAGGSSGASEEVDRSQLFAALNKGGAVTSGLKKVTNDMKTHKNPALRNQGPVAAAKASSSLSPRPYSPPKFKKFNAPEVKKPPKFELQDKKWIIEHQDGNQNLVIDRTNDKQAVYMYKCKNSVLQVQGKINSIVLDNCVKCGVVFTDLISTCEFINCQSVKAQANGYVPTISIDKTDGCQVFLNEKNLDVQIISAKSSEMNICINNEDGDLNEFPLPEQYKTVWDGKKFVTTVMDLNL